jgi:hypothetical protein
VAIQRPSKSDHKEKHKPKMFDAAKTVDKTKEAQKMRKTTDEGFKIYTMEELRLG